MIILNFVFQSVLKQRQSIPSTTTTSKIFGRTSIGTGHDTALSSSYPKAPGFERLQFSVISRWIDLHNPVCMF
jgi:hypothetical protein